MFGFPGRIIPFQVVKQYSNTRYVVQVLGHPLALENPLWNVPLVRSPLHRFEKSLELNELNEKILKKYVWFGWWKRMIPPE